MSETVSSHPIDFSSVSPEQFERLVYFLLDDMGFKNIEWRKGGNGISATDGGRDLEATYTKIGPDDQLIVEKWWVEVKYRSHVLAPETVHDIVLNAAVRPKVDVLAIATNNVISNKTTDWIKDLATKQPTPRIVTWQAHDLERLLRKYPAIRERFFYGSLTIAERLEAAQQAFWNALSFPTPEAIDEFWADRGNLDWSGSNLLPIVIAEASSDRFNLHRWGSTVKGELLGETLVVGLANTTSLIVRLGELGRTTICLVDALSYLLESALHRMDLQEVVDIVDDPLRFTDATYDYPSELRDIISHPILANMYHDLLDSCRLDCARFRGFDESKETSVQFWYRFTAEYDLADKSKPSVLLQALRENCTLELVSAGDSCPLCEEMPSKGLGRETLRDLLAVAQAVIQKRVTMALRSTSM